MGITPLIIFLTNSKVFWSLLNERVGLLLGGLLSHVWRGCHLLSSLDALHFRRLRRKSEKQSQIAVCVLYPDSTQEVAYFRNREYRATIQHGWSYFIPGEVG